MYVPAVDHESFDISYYFEDANNFIDEERKRTNVLVHCMAGISRSVSLVIAYLIKHHDKTFN
jgi:protein-tyrosine phosphatase